MFDEPGPQHATDMRRSAPSSTTASRSSSQISSNCRLSPRLWQVHGVSRRAMQHPGGSSRAHEDDGQGQRRAGPPPRACPGCAPASAGDFSRLARPGDPLAPPTGRTTQGHLRGVRFGVTGRQRRARRPTVAPLLWAAPVELVWYPKGGSVPARVAVHSPVIAQSRSTGLGVRCGNASSSDTTPGPWQVASAARAPSIRRASTSASEHGLPGGRCGHPRRPP